MLIDNYHAAIAAKGFGEDSEQLKIIGLLEAIAQRLQRPAPRPSLWQRLRGQPAATPYVGGLYCWGGVGRGKTFLMDLFFDYLPGTRKRRRHYHRFMLELHEALRQAGNRENPIDYIVANLKQELDVVLLDEFAVSDITDAMLLAKLMENFERHNIALVTTSNIEPDNLYKNGLQRERFLPAIAWIKEKLTVHHVADGEDYRHRHFHAENVFRSPNDAANNAALLRDLTELTSKPLDDHSPFHMNGRTIPIVARNQQTIVFDFADLCQGYFSPKDYIEIGKRFALMGIVNVPVMYEDQDDAAKRFLLLVDEFYDRSLKLLLTSAVPVAEIYRGRKLAFEYERVQSRLFEMQSSAYWDAALRE